MVVMVMVSAGRPLSVVEANVVTATFIDKPNLLSGH